MPRHNQGSNTISANYVARASWNEEDQSWVWSDLDRGVGGYGDQDHVLSSVVRPTETTNAFELFVGGCFERAGLKRSYQIARWAVGFPEPEGGTIPSIQITNPANYATFTNLATISITAEAEVSSDVITDVQFYVSGTLIAAVTTNVADPTITVDWSPTEPGVYVLESVAVANERWTVSDPVFIQVRQLAGTEPAEDPESAPVAVPDTVLTTLNGGPLIINVLTNDTTSTQGMRVIKIGTYVQPSGSATIAPDGSYITYSPAANTFGTSAFDYTITDASGGQNSALVTVHTRVPPVVSLTAFPSYLSGSGTTDVNVTTSDYDGSVTNIEIFVNGVLTWQTSASSFQTNWNVTSPGFYQILAIARDSDGLSKVSSAATVEVTDANNVPQAVIISPAHNLTTNEYGLEVLERALIREGLFEMLGEASDSESDVSYQVILAQPDGLELYANLTPGPLDSWGFHPGGDTNGSLGFLNFSQIRNGGNRSRAIW